MLNAYYARQMMMAAQGAGGAEEKDIVKPQTIVKYNDDSIVEYDIQGQIKLNTIPNKANIVEVKIGSDVSSIDNFAFAGCNLLSSVYIPETVTNIGNEAFWLCSSLISAQIPNSISSIGADMFSECSSLTSVQMPNSISSIGGGAFYGCTSLSSIQLPTSLISIGNSAFTNCTSLSSITCNRMSAPTVQKNAFGYLNKSYTGRNTYDQGINKLYVPTGATGYDSSYWADPLQDASKCGFTIEYI